MKEKNLINYLHFLVLSLVFIIFLSTNVNSAIENCLTDLNNNSFNNFQSEDFTCNTYDFSNLDNVTFNCNNYKLYNYNGIVNFANSNISFINCYFDLTNEDVDFSDSDLLLINSSVNNVIGIGYNAQTNIVFENSFVESEDFSSFPQGFYDFYELISFNITDINYSLPVLEFTINVSSLSQNYEILFENKSEYLVRTHYYNQSALTNFNNFNISVFSNMMGDLAYVSQDLMTNKIVSLQLNDFVSPKYNIEPTVFTNNSLSFNISFNELVDGTFYLRNVSGIVQQINVSNFITSYIFTTNNLIPDSVYYLSLDIQDRYFNSNTSGLIGPYKTYITLNATSNLNDSFVYTGNPQNTSSFEFSNNYGKIEYLEPVNLSNNFNLSNEIILEDNFVYVDSSSRFNKIVRIFLSNLDYQSTPFVLKNGNLCTNASGCYIEDYNSNTLVFNVSGFSNYSTISNSVLDINLDHQFAGIPINLTVNYSIFDDNTPINGSCNIDIDSNIISLNFSNQTNLYSTILNYSTVSNYPYTITCISSIFDDKINSSVLVLEHQTIDDFTTLIDFNDLGSKLTKTKYFNISINSVGTNNTDNYFDTQYSFLISRDITYPQTNWNVSKNLTGWINIDKQEFVEIFNNGESYTSYRLQNGTSNNFSQFIFIDERDLDGNGISLYATVRACVSSGECTYYSDDTNNLIFEDTTGPELVGDIFIDEFYNQNDFLNFSFLVRDFESNVKSVKYDVQFNDSISNSPTNSISFLENKNSTFSSLGFNFEEGEIYKIVLEAENKIGLKSSIFESRAFTIDTIAPVNSSLFVNVSENEYYDSLILNLSFDAGEDYQFNYSSLGIEASGLDYQKIIYQNSSLQNNECSSWGDLIEVNKTFTKTNTSYQVNITDSYCYNFFYKVFDKAGNYNLVEFNKTIKVDLTEPEINLIDGKDIIDFTDANPNNAENIQKNYGNLDEDSVLFKVKWNITDNQSLINYYNIDLINNDSGEVVQSFTNYSFSTFEVKFNQTYIKDNTNYKVRVSAVNFAGLESSSIITNGATIFLLKVPLLEIYYYYYIGESVFDFSDDNLTSLEFYDKNNFNVSCKFYETDLGYQNDTGTFCLSNDNNVTCNFNTKLGLNEFFVSCLSNESVKADRTFNNQSNNYDVKIYVEENILPQVNFSDEFNLNEDEEFNHIFSFYDNNSMNYLVGNFSKKIDELEINFEGSEDFKNNIVLNFIDDNRENNSLTILDNVYSFYFNNSISYLDVRNLCLANENCDLSFSSVNWSEELSQGVYDLIDSINNYSSGVSNNINFINLTNDRGYNFSFNLQTGQVLWDLENQSIRQDRFNLTFWIKDDLDINKQNITINVNPIYYSPIINQSFYDNFKEFNLTQYQLKLINISEYFFEENSKVGLNESLDYFYLNKENINIQSFNKTSGELILYSTNIGISSLEVGAINIENQTNQINLSFNIFENSDNITPQINVLSPVNDYVLNSSKKVFFTQIQSNENLAKIWIQLDGIEYFLCDGFCSNVSSEIAILNLKEGDNNLSFNIEDFGGNTNSTSINLSYVFNKTAKIEDTIYSNINASFYVNNESNLSQNFSGIQNIEFKENDIIYVKFDFDFDGKNLSFENSSIILDNSTDAVSLIVSGLNLQNQTKNILIPTSSNNDFSSICIKDEEIFSISEMDLNCQGSNEYYLNCDNVSDNGYSCSQINQEGIDFYQISGLRNSGVKLMCTENWQTGDWSSCSGSSQTRSVIDLNNCGTEFNKPDTSQSCSSGGSSSGSGSSSSSSGGSSSSSSRSKESSYIPIPEKEEIVNETQIEDVEVIVPAETDFNNPIYLGDLNNEIRQELEVGKKYSFNLNGQSVEGELVDGFSGLIFKTNSQDIGFDKMSIDVDNDGQDDLEVYLKQEGENVYLTSEKIEILTEPKEELIFKEESNNSFLIWLFTGIILIVFCGLVYFSYSYYLRNKHSKDNFNVEKVKANIVNQTAIDSQRKSEAESQISKIYVNFDSIADKLVLYSDNLVEIINQENDLIDLIKDDSKKMVKSGFSWTDIYFYLKSKHLSKFYISKIIDFEYLIDNIEQFVLQNNVSEMPKEILEEKLMSQNWVSELYIYDGDGKDILRDILFMISASNIYGFRRDKFKELFNDELERGKKEFISINFNAKFKEANISQDSFDLLERVQNDLEILRKELFEVKNQIKKSNLNEKEKKDLLIIAEELDEDIRKHLD